MASPTVLTTLLFLFLIVCRFANGQIEFPGRCLDDIVVQKNFNISAYLGVWYEINRYEHRNEIEMNCVTANYTLINATTVKVHNAGIIKNKLYERFGQAVPLNSSSTDAKLLVSFEENQTPSPYWVLQTDYSSYSLVYSCRTLNESYKAVTSWILSRRPALSGQDAILIDKYITDNKNVQDVLAWSNYYHTIQWGDVCKSGGVSLAESPVLLLLTLLGTILTKMIK